MSLFSTDSEHRRFIQRAQQDAVRMRSQPSANIVAFTTFAPTNANGTPGLYYTKFMGSVWPRASMISWMADDLSRGKMDCNSNAPCWNEVFSDCTSVRPFVDFDIHDRHVDEEWVRAYAVFIARTFAAAAGSERTPTVAVCTVLESDATIETRKMRVLGESMWKCPFCRGQVRPPMMQATEEPVRDAGKRTNPARTATVWECRICAARWKCEDGFADAPKFTVVGRTRMQAKGTYSSKAKRSRDALITSLDLDSGDANSDAPAFSETTKVGVHFRLIDVSVSPADLLEFVRILRAKSVSFRPTRGRDDSHAEGTLQPTDWANAIDSGPAKNLSLRAVLMDKAVPCAACKGRRSVGVWEAHIGCVECYASGRTLRGAPYQVLDVLLPGFSADPMFTWMSRAREAADVKFWRRFCTDELFILQQTCIAMTDNCRVEHIARDRSIPQEAHEASVSTSTKPAARVLTLQQRSWLRSSQGAKSPVDPRRHDRLLRMISRVNPLYASCFIPVNGAFYSGSSGRRIIVHLDGEESTLCPNKQAFNASEPHHATSRVYALISPRGVSLRCFCQKAEYGCNSWRGTPCIALTSDEVEMFFASDTRASTGSSVMSDIMPLQTLSQFARQLMSSQGGKAYLRRMHAMTKSLNCTSSACASREVEHPYSVMMLLTVFDSWNRTPSAMIATIPLASRALLTNTRARTAMFANRVQRFVDGRNHGRAMAARIGSP